MKDVTEKLNVPPSCLKMQSMFKPLSSLTVYIGLCCYAPDGWVSAPTAVFFISHPYILALPLISSLHGNFFLHDTSSGQRVFVKAGVSHGV